MKLNDLFAQLETIKAKYGDLDVDISIATPSQSGGYAAIRSGPLDIVEVEERSTLNLISEHEEDWSASDLLSGGPRPLTREEALVLVQALQSELWDLYRDGNLNLQDTNPEAFAAGLLAWESTRLFWYALRGDAVGVNEKHQYVLQALKRFEEEARG